MLPPPIIATPAEDGQTVSTGNLLVRLTVVPACVMRSAPAAPTAVIDFGEIGSGTTPIVSKLDRESANALTIRCSSRDATPTVSLSGGMHTLGTRRYLMNGPVRVGYELYRDPALSEPWRPGVPYPVAIRQPDVAEPVSIYGRVPAPGEATLPGTYSDVVLVTLGY